MTTALQNTRPKRWPAKPQWLRVVREGEVEVTSPPTIRSPADAAALLRMRGAHLEEVEVFYVILLDAQNNVRGAQEVARGILNSAPVHPREVFRLAVVHGAAGIIIAHNHPSGNPAPSGDDKAVTVQMLEAGKLLDIPVHDHLIVCGDNFFSFAEAGLL